MIKETIPFNFDEIYKSVEKKFTDEGYDIQPGSNTMQLATAMSYLVSMLNANTAVNINETLLTLARKRKMVLNDARVLGYEVQHKTSYKYNLTLEFSTIGTHVIKKYSKFASGDKLYYFMSNMGELEPIVTVVDEPVQITIEVIEGELIRYLDEQTLTKQIESIFNEVKKIEEVQYYIDIPFTNVEDTGLEVFLTYYDDSGILHELEPWTRSDSFVIDKDTILNRQYIRLDSIDYETPRIYFKLGNVGKELRVGTIIQVNVLRSSDTQGEITDIPSSVDLDCIVNSYELIAKGADEESIQSIKQNAPLFHNSANRIVTKPDYISFCNRQSLVHSTDVWDGHDEFPIRSGHIWFSFLSSNTIREFTEDETGTFWILNDLQNYVNWYINDYSSVFRSIEDYKIPTLIFHHRNPVYFDFNYKINIVRYNSAVSKSERNKLVFEVFNNYFLGDETSPGAEVFKFEYFESNLNKRIDTELSDLMGFNISLNTTISLNSNNIITENVVDELALNKTYYNEIRFHLSTPFENWIDNFGVINTTILPIIDTLNFVGIDSLTVDYSTSTSEDNGLITIYNILLGSVIVGKYKVYTGIVETIEIILFVISDGAYIEGLSLADITSEVTLDIKYPSPNIKFNRNTIPRLKSVEFT